MSSGLRVAHDVIRDVRAACEKSGRSVQDAEIARALEGLDEATLQAVRRSAQDTPAVGPLGPEAFVDIASGVAPAKAAARELSGYYELKAERDTLATLAGQTPKPRPEAPRTLSPAPQITPRTGTSRIESAIDKEEQQLMTLFAYHRDAVRVAQEMGISLFELNERLEQLGLRRRIHRLVESTTDIELFSPERMERTKTPLSTAPFVRRRSEKTDEPKTIPELPPVEKTEPPEPTSTPTVNSSPVNAHGTRVYRRPGAETPALGTNPAGSRREYVREPRRAAKSPSKPPAKEKTPPPARHAFSELESGAGADVLKRLLSVEKANPRVLAARLAERYDAPGETLGESELRALLDRHGLAEDFAEKEKANTLFLIGFHQGARAKLAHALLLNPEEMHSYLTRLGLADELERVRQERSRMELGRRRMTDRVVQVLTRAPYLDDLGVLQIIDREVRDWLEEQHAREADPERIEVLRNLVGLEKNAFAKLLRRYGLEPSATAASAS